MILSRVLSAAIVLGFAQAQTCPSNDNGQCDFEPTNPYSCGEDYSCAYKSRCLAEAAGFNIENDCCQAPQPSSCAQVFSPLICGTKECPYDNECIASLAGYTSDQCTAPPPECPEGGNCSGEPSNPYTCGPNRCEYATTCDVNAAGFDLSADCCQDTRSNTVCPGNIAAVSCGPPGGKQCGYSNQCLAEAAGYSSSQCCNAVPDGTVCQAISEPVSCGNIPCVYSNQCEADAAGATGCCRHPVTEGCAMDYAPVLCGMNSCRYENSCVATKSGFDYNSCVPAPDATPQVATMGADEAEDSLEDNADAIEDNADAIEDNVQDLDPLEDDGNTDSAAPKESVIAAAVGMALAGAALL